MTMIINKKKFLYNFLILSFYLSLLIPYINGFLDLYFPSYYKKLFLSFAQAVIFLVPIYLVLFVPVRIPKFFIALFLYLYLIVLIPFSEYFDLKAMLFGFKNYFLVFLYIPILYYLMKEDVSFSEKIEKHFRRVFYLAAGILFFEYLSVRFFISSPYIFLRKLAGSNYPLLGKPNGIDLGIHLQGYIFSIAVFYFIANKKYLIAFIMFTALFLSTVKTWIVAFILSFIIYILSVGSIKTIVKILFVGTFFALILIWVNPGIFHHYAYSFSSKSSGTFNMVSQVIDSKELFLNSFLPNGLVYDLPDRHLPFYIQKSEIFAYYLLFQIGVIGMILFCLVLFSGVFIKENKYRVIIILSFFSIAHTYAPGRFYVFIMLAYFGSYYIVQKRERVISMEQV